MANVRIIVDDKTFMDAQVTLRSGDLPTMDQLRGSLEQSAGGQFKPWAASALGTLGAELLPAKFGGSIPDITIDVTTLDNDGYDIRVRHSEHASPGQH